MTSWFVTASISSTSSLLKEACSAIQAASSLVMPILPSSACASQAATSISCQMAYLFCSSQMAPVSGAGVAFDHAGSSRCAQGRGGTRKTICGQVYGGRTEGRDERRGKRKKRKRTGRAEARRAEGRDTGGEGGAQGGRGGRRGRGGRSISADLAIKVRVGPPVGAILNGLPGGRGGVGPARTRKGASRPEEATPTCTFFANPCPHSRNRGDKSADGPAGPFNFARIGRSDQTLIASRGDIER